MIYCYDGTFDGLMCCVFESVYRKESPSEIRADDMVLLPVRRIANDAEKAERVIKGIRKKLGDGALHYAKIAFLTAYDRKELMILDYLKYGFKYGKQIYTAVANEFVAPVLAANKTIWNEAHRMKEFVRFSDYGAALVSVIEPTHNVLPLITEHFSDRLPRETFMIYDKSRGVAFVHAEGKGALIDVDELDLPEAGEEEKKFRKLWKLFYDTVEIKERHSDRGRMNHLPKKYWHNMTEFK